MKTNYAKFQPITWDHPRGGSFPITSAQLRELGIDPSAHEVRGDLKTIGPWQLPISYRALCTSTVYTPEDRARWTAQMDSETLWGWRTLSHPKESGYVLEGRVSVNGKSVRGFTSSQLFEVTDLPGSVPGSAHLISVATIHACL